MLRRLRSIVRPQMVLMFDEAFARGVVPKGYRIVAGYLKSKADLHTWTRADWARFGKMKKLPIYVSPTVLGQGTTPEADAFECLRMLFDLGVPKGSAVALDMETSVNADYVNRFAAVLRWAGYFVWVYGSASTVFKNPGTSTGGYWVADYAGKGPFMYNHPRTVATQYADGSATAPYDSSLVKWWQYVDRIKVW